MNNIIKNQDKESLLNNLGTTYAEVVSEALAILNRKWEDISVTDYDRAIEMLRSINAYPELINTLRNGIFIKGENGWKVKRSDKIEALRLAEDATREGENVTLKDWANLYENKGDCGSAFQPNRTDSGILESFYSQGSGLAALILGDMRFESALWPIGSGYLYDSVTKEIQPKLVEIMANELKTALEYYDVAGMRGYAIGYRTQSLIYEILGKKDLADELEHKYSNAPYADKRVAFNLLRDYETTGQYYDRKACIESKEEERVSWGYWQIPLPLSLMALDTDTAKEYLNSIFDSTITLLKQYIG